MFICAIRSLYMLETRNYYQLRSYESMSRMIRFFTENLIELMKIHKFPNRKISICRWCDYLRVTYMYQKIGIALSPLRDHAKVVQNQTKRNKTTLDWRIRDNVEYRGLNRTSTIYLRFCNAWTGCHKTKWRLISTRVYTYVTIAIRD